VQKDLDQQVVERKSLQQQLNAPSIDKAGNQTTQKPQPTGAKAESTTEVEGYKMEKLDSSDTETQVTSSGMEWMAGLVVLCFIALGLYGMKRARKL
jgi:cobaltochelatase CobN